MVHSFGSTTDFVIKKGTFGIFTGFGHFQMSEKSGRNANVYPLYISAAILV
jgi:hypothetical protein